MKTIKRIVLILLALILIGCLFRGWLYRQVVTYRSIGERTNYAANNPELLAYLEAHAPEKTTLKVREIIKVTLSLTSNYLTFTAGKNDNDPNRLIHSRKAHCVGYAAFFATACNYLFRKYDLDDNWVATPQVGQLYAWGINVHPYLASAFFKDHDFVLITNKKTGDRLAVDPSVNDYFWIDFVTFTQ